ncbi:hypothetical protein GOODEAATRI_009927, partial [Goodea atripinnis]
TDALLVKLSLLVGQQVFYGALWGSMLVTPMVRLPASVFVVTHFDRMAPLSQQTHMLGYGHRAVDPAEPSVALSAEDMTTVVSAALLTLLRRDMSLNRRLYAWLLGPHELYADIQSLFLPDMLGTMLHSLRRHMDSISLDEDGHNEGQKKGSANGHQEDERERLNGGGEAEPANGVYSTLRSEDSGLGISASPSEQHLQLGMVMEAERNGTCKTGVGVWRRGGSVEAMTQCLQDILAFITTRYLMVQVEDVGGPEPEPQHDQSANSVDHKSLLGRREFKDKLTELFTPNKLKVRVSPETQLPASPTEKKKWVGSTVGMNWAAGYMPRGRAEISEACRQTFVATCHLLLESTTFPVYLSEEEMLALYTDMDYNIQHTAVASLLELVNHSQSLALVIEDKHKRYQSSDTNPLSGRLQMVSVPPIYPVLLRAIEDGTDFFQVRLSKGELLV